MTTPTFHSEQLPIINEQVFKSNFNFLMKNNTWEELKLLTKSLGEKIIKNNLRLKKDELCNVILNSKKFIFKSLEELQEINRKDEYEKKVKYYKELKERLYKDTKKIENKNYDKPCLVFENDIERIQVEKKGYFKWVISYCLYNNIFIENLQKVNKKGEKLEVCHGHNCPKKCIEPSHLSLKTKSENNYEDKIRDGTLTRGEKHSNSKISEELALQIKNSKGDGRTQKERFEYFLQVNPKLTINIINHLDRNNSSWSYLPDKNGIITDNTKEKNKKIKKRKNKAKLKKFTNNDWIEALDRLRKRSIDSDDIVKNGKVNTKCWLFKGCLRWNGYGKITFKLIDYQTHILAWEAFHKTKQDNKDLVIRHLCDIKNCCNTEHLQLGTRQENVIDFLPYSKGVKLNEEKIKDIRKLLKEGILSQGEIAEKYNIARCNISLINTGKAWKHVV